MKSLAWTILALQNAAAAFTSPAVKKTAMNAEDVKTSQHQPSGRVASNGSV
jgi:hypothetical protein